MKMAPTNVWTLHLVVSRPGRDWGQEEKGTTENEMDREAWRAAIHGVTKSRIQLSD